MIWNGADPLQPGHEVAYRGWPTIRVRVFLNIIDPPWVVSTSWPEVQQWHALIHHLKDGRSEMGARFDLIPLQQQEPAK